MKGGKTLKKKTEKRTKSNAEGKTKREKGTQRVPKKSKGSRMQDEGYKERSKAVGRKLVFCVPRHRY